MGIPISSARTTGARRNREPLYFHGYKCGFITWFRCRHCQVSIQIWNPILQPPPLTGKVVYDIGIRHEEIEFESVGEVLDYPADVEVNAGVEGLESFTLLASNRLRRNSCVSCCSKIQILVIFGRELLGKEGGTYEGRRKTGEIHGKGLTENLPPTICVDVP